MAGCLLWTLGTGTVDSIHFAFYMSRTYVHYVFVTEAGSSNLRKFLMLESTQALNSFLHRAILLLILIAFFRQLKTKRGGTERLLAHFIEKSKIIRNWRCILSNASQRCKIEKRLHCNDYVTVV